MRRLIRWFVCKYIREHMGHVHATDRDAIFYAIGQGMKEEFTEDNFNTRLNYTVLQLVTNDPEAVRGYIHMGKRLYHDTHSAALCAADAVREAMRNVPTPEWRRKQLEAENLL